MIVSIERGVKTSRQVGDSFCIQLMRAYLSILYSVKKRIIYWHILITQCWLNEELYWEQTAFNSFHGAVRYWFWQSNYSTYQQIVKSRASVVCDRAEPANWRSTRIVYGLFAISHRGTIIRVASDSPRTGPFPGRTIFVQNCPGTYGAQNVTWLGQFRFPLFSWFWGSVRGWWGWVARGGICTLWFLSATVRYCTRVMFISLVCRL